jgi:hypothetical protein
MAKKIKRLFFLHSRNKTKIKELRKDDIIIYLGTSFQKDEKKKDSLEYHYLTRTEEEARQARFSYNMAWIQKWAFGKANGKKSFAEELVYEGKSLWYPAEYFIHFDESILGSEPSVSRLLIYIDCINNILKDKKPSSVYVENNRSCFNNLVILLCKKEKIDVKELGFEEKKRSLYQTLSDNPLLARAYISGRVLLRFLVGKLYCKKLGRADVLLLTSDRLSNRENATDYFWGPLVREMDKAGLGHKVVEYDRIETMQSIVNLWKKYIPQRYDAQFIGTYHDGEVSKRIRKTVAFLKEKFEELDSNQAFRESFDYKGIKFYGLIRSRLKKIFLTYSYYIAEVYAVSKAIIEKEKPKLILLDHEKNYYGRALITEANFKKIPTIAFEGEVIYDYNTYLTQIPVPEILNKKSPIWRPIPDKKLLWSEYSREWYEQKYYFPKENLRVIGAPKYDFLKELNAKDKQEIMKKYDVPNEKKLITLITMDCPWENEYLGAVFKSLKGRRDLKIIVKIHPADSPKKRRIEEMIRKFDIDAIVLRHENSSKLIYASDFLITYTSTLVYECILMDKKTILADFGVNINLPFVKEGLLRLCKNSFELEEEIRAYFLKNKEMNELKRQAFIKKYLYSDDGAAAKRAVDEIKKSLKK